MSIFSIFKESALDGNSNVNIVEINGYTLPPNVLIRIDSDKIIAEHQIIDGEPVFERIADSAKRVEFEFSFVKTSGMVVTNGKIQGIISPVTTVMGQPVEKYSYPIDLYDDFLQKVVLPNEVLPVKNTLLNTRGIYYLIVQSDSCTPERGRMDLPVTLRCLSDKYNTKNNKTSLLI